MFCSNQPGVALDIPCIPWTFPGHSLDIPWTFPGHSLDIPWTFPGHSLDIPWTFPDGDFPRRIPGGSQEDPRRTSGGSQEDLRRIPGGSQEDPRRMQGFLLLHTLAHFKHTGFRMNKSCCRHHKRTLQIRQCAYLNKIIHINETLIDG
jgi:hypothetical protein